MYVTRTSSSTIDHTIDHRRINLSRSSFFDSIQAYDQHLNMILGNVEEVVTSVEIDEETDEEIVKKQTRQIGMLFVRGDIVVLVSPPLRT